MIEGEIQDPEVIEEEIELALRGVKRVKRGRAL